MYVRTTKNQFQKALFCIIRNFITEKLFTLAYRVVRTSVQCLDWKATDVQTLQSSQNDYG